MVRNSYLNESKEPTYIGSIQEGEQVQQGKKQDEASVQLAKQRSIFIFSKRLGRCALAL
jgi:hypothetical protein